ncbi:hypothetical protein [Streptomyces lunaelactis]|uniref:hypothetical protein n=1 Tax=Streptomyces lunaelactis TaxID=1535768 RepID=UPI0020C775B2|nr:hypothetical protein [Streptomyces lunaelactis]
MAWRTVTTYRLAEDSADGVFTARADLAASMLGQPTDDRYVRKAVSVARIDVSASADIVGAMWHKWVFITTVGALTCLMRGTVGDVVAAPVDPAWAPPSWPRPPRCRPQRVPPSPTTNSPPSRRR